MSSTSIEVPSHALSVRGISKTYGSTQALDDVGMVVERGSVHALAGGNGSGKSTLIKVLAGVVKPNAGGQIETSSGTRRADDLSPEASDALGLRFVHQDLGLFQDLSVADNLMTHKLTRRSGLVSHRQMRRDAQDILDQFEIDVRPTTELGRLRPTEQTLVAIARTLSGVESGASTVLFLDEPTARLPHHEVDDLLERLNRYARAGQSIVFVSHRLEEVLTVCNSVTILRDGRHVMTGTTDGMTREDLVHGIVGRSIDDLSQGRLEEVSSLVEPVLRVEGLTGGPLDDVTLDVRPGEVVGVAGLVGSGRTSLLETIMGVQPRQLGHVEVAGRSVGELGLAGLLKRRVAYVPEDRHRLSLFPQMSIVENLAANKLRRYRRHGAVRERIARSDAQTERERFSIKCASVEAAVSSLSGGNQQKVVLGRWLSIDPVVVLLDEPTQGVDVGARADIYIHIREAANAGTGVLLVSSDLEELLQLSTRIVVMRSGRLIANEQRTALSRDRLVRLVFDIESEGRTLL